MIEQSEIQTKANNLIMNCAICTKLMNSIGGSLIIFECIKCELNCFIYDHKIYVYYFNGNIYSEKEFNNFLKLKAFW